MIIILNISADKFSLNGIPYFKNFMPHVLAGKLKIVNIYDTKFNLTEFYSFNNYSVDGVIYTNLSDLQNALLPVLYTRNTLNPNSYFPKHNDLVGLNEGIDFLHINKVEKDKLINLSGINTGDQDLSPYALVAYVEQQIGNIQEILSSDNLDLDTFQEIVDEIEKIQNQINNVSVNDATTLAKGIIKLSGDLSGTADAPTVPALATKQDILTNPVTGVGTSNCLPKFSENAQSSLLEDSQIFDNEIGVSFGGRVFFGGYEFLKPEFGNNTIYLGVPDGFQNPRAFISHQSSSGNQDVIFGSAFSSGNRLASWIFESGILRISALSGNGKRKVIVDEVGNLSAELQTEVVALTPNYTFQLGDEKKIFVYNSATSANVFFEKNSVVPFPISSQITIFVQSAGAVNPLFSTPATNINNTVYLSKIIQGETRVYTKIAQDSWIANSDLGVTVATDIETQISSAVTEDNKVVSRLKLFNWWTWVKSQAQTISGLWTFSDKVTLTTGTTTKHPLLIPVGSKLSTLINGAIETDSNGIYYTISGVRHNLINEYLYKSTNPSVMTIYGTGNPTSLIQDYQTTTGTGGLYFSSSLNQFSMIELESEFRIEANISDVNVGLIKFELQANVPNSAEASSWITISRLTTTASDLHSLYGSDLTGVYLKMNGSLFFSDVVLKSLNSDGVDDFLMSRNVLRRRLNVSGVTRTTANIQFKIVLTLETLSNVTSQVAYMSQRYFSVKIIK